MIHTSVLKKEVIEYLNPKANENFIDGTAGEGGHDLLILEKNSPNGMVLMIDWDINQIGNAKKNISRFKDRVLLVNDSYVNIDDIVEKNNFKPVNGIMIDLGYSSWQIEESKKGFSFNRDEILDMRYDDKNVLTAEKIVNDYSEKELENILHNFGEEKFAKKIAKKIVESRKKSRIKSTLELKNIIESVYPEKMRYGRINCATKSFQALRIVVNRELDNLKEFLPKAISLLSKDGRLVIISFHSLEDRIIKNFLKEKSEEGVIKILTKKPVIASPEEVLSNPRARSAKLRAAVKISI